MNRKFTSSVSSALVLLSALSGEAVAADNDFYVGAGIAQSSIDRRAAAGVDIGDSTRFKFIAGMQLLEWLGFEANYIGSGRVGYSTDLDADADITAVTAFAIGYLDVGLVDLYAKGGVARWELDGSSNASAHVTGIPDDGVELAYGGGVRFTRGRLGIRLEYEGFDMEAANGIELLSLGLTWTFR